MICMPIPAGSEMISEGLEGDSMEALTGAALNISEED